MFCKVFFNLKVKGLYNFPKQGGIIAVANHTSYLDPVVVATAISRRIYWIVMKPVYYFRPLHWLFVITKCIPLNGAVDKAVDTLKKGRVIAIFPEGGRSRTGKIQETKTGVAAIALESQMPVLPIAIVGAFEAYPPTASFPRMRPVEVRIGKPMIFAKKYKEQKATDTELKETTLQIIGSLNQLIEGGINESKSRS